MIEFEDKIEKETSSSLHINKRFFKVIFQMLEEVKSRQNILPFIHEMVTLD